MLIRVDAHKERSLLVSTPSCKGLADERQQQLVHVIRQGHNRNVTHSKWTKCVVLLELVNGSEGDGPLDDTQLYPNLHATLTDSANKQQPKIVRLL